MNWFKRLFAKKEKSEVPNKPKNRKLEREIRRTDAATNDLLKGMKRVR